MERFSSTLRRVFSAQSIFSFVLVVIITTLFSVLIGGQVTHAANPTDAAWSGESIVYSNHGYTVVTDFKDPTGTIPDGSTVYQTPVQTSNNSDKKVFILYFTPGVDPPTATSAKYVEFSSSTTGKLSDPKNAKEVTLTVKGQEDEASSCSVSGIGWIVCPVSVFLAEAMDNVFNILSDMIKVQPSVLGDPNNSMYIAWNTMRNIANVAFVIVFLIIIYSQLTSFGVSNYGLKKLIPRLIIAAILVNVSFIVSAIAIDISNILGYSIQNVFNGIRENVFNLTDDNFGAVNAAVDNPWARLTTVILAGGGAIGGVYYLASGGLYMLIPLLLGLILTLIFVVIVLAARQAIIVILVIISPIAFVANLLPNTEKWFDKWKDLFMTMLIFFPAFSLVFGGSQLAGQLIIQNAGGNIVTVLFGMAVQIAPLVITPLLLKFSGSLLGRIAQIANNPSKGILDRNKNWAGARADYTKQRNIAGEGRKFNPTTWGAGMVRNTDFRKRRLKDKTDAFKQGGDNLYHDSPGYTKIHTDMAGKELDKEKIQNRNAAHIEGLKVAPGSTLYDRAIKTQASKENFDAATNRTNEHFNQRRVVGGNPLNISSNNLEASKARLETSENAKSAYLNQQRMMAGSVLNRTVAPLEASKLRVESSQNQYTNMVENMKLNPGSSLYHVSQGVQSSKEILEASQSNVQALFDRQRRTVGTGLNMSTIQLENSKAVAEASKSSTAEYINIERATAGTQLYTNTVNLESAKAAAQTSETNLARVINNVKADDTTLLHRNIIRSEDAKLATQVSETNLNRIIDEYKTGEVARTGELGTLTTSMTSNVEELAAQAQGVQAAQNIQKRNIAQAFTETIVVDGKKVKTTRAEELLNIAASVDQYGGVRAESGALSTLERIVDEARGSNVKLIETRALASGKTVKDYVVNDLLKPRLENNDMSESEDLIRAALEIAGQEAQIPILRKIRRSANFNKDDVSAMLNRQQNVMKVKGGFDLQANPDLANISEATMDASIAGMLGSVAPKDFAGLKFAAVVDYGNRIDEIVTNTENETNPAYGPNARQGLEKTFFNLTLALKDPELIRELGDNLAPAIDIHKRLQEKFKDNNVGINYDAIDPREVTHDKVSADGDGGAGNSGNTDSFGTDSSDDQIWPS